MSAPYVDDEEGFLDDEPISEVAYDVNAGLSPEEIKQREEEQAAIQRENLALLEQVPDPVKKFVIRLHQALSAQNVKEIHELYEKVYNQLSAEYYKVEEWPRAEVVSSLVRNDEVFLTFYRELYFRHLYSRFSHNIDIDDRFDSYENYCNLFNYILNSEGPVPLELPNSWLWDIIDEFIWQFGAFAVWRSRTKDKTEDEVMLLSESPAVWSCYSVLNVLYSLIQKSKVHEHLKAVKEGQDVAAAVDVYGARPLYRMLGYFSIIGLLRVHILTGDYALGLSVMDGIDLKSMVNVSTRLHTVHAAHISVYYYVGTAYLMLRRYNDAIDVLNKGVAHFLKNRHFSGGDQLAKAVDRMVALIAIAHSLSPSIKLEDWVKQNIADKYGDAVHKISRASGATLEETLDVYEDLFMRACPKFVSPTPPPLDGPENAQYNDPTKHQWNLLASDIRSLSTVQDTKSFLKLYTTLSTEKMANLLAKSEAEVVEDLAVVSGASRGLKWSEGSLLSGEVDQTATDVTFSIDKDNIVIVESKKARQVGDYFLRRSIKAAEEFQKLRNKPLPQPATLQQQQQQSKPSAAPVKTAAAVVSDAKTVAWAR